MEILHIENLSFAYPKSEKKALDNINLSFKAGSFNVICGESGCGKTTLLKMLKRELAPAGDKSGEVFYRGKSLAELEPRVSAAEIGFVMQNPESQIVTDKVWHELAFGLESLGVDSEVIRRRVAEMSSYFGIEGWFGKKTNELSGGQKQLLNLASVMVMQPNILILDEPTSRLDPIAASDFIATLCKMNRELSLTVIIAEHRLEELLPVADSVTVMENGRVIAACPPREVSGRLKAISESQRMLSALPSATRIFEKLNLPGVCPLTVREGRDFLEKSFGGAPIAEYKEKPYTHSDGAAIELKNVWFRYERNLPDILKNTSLKVYEGESYFILGGNGVGKTTALGVIAGLNRAYRGKTMILGKKIKEYKGAALYRHCLSLLPQEPQNVFLKDTVLEDFEDMLKTCCVPKAEHAAKIEEITGLLDIAPLLSRHPFDLSGGEQQKCAIAKIMLSEPRILLLDEPTKGFDAHSKQNLSEILKKLKARGITVVTVTHDIEFAAENADRCGLFFDGEIISSATPNEFFGGNSFYTTAAGRISRFVFKNAVTVEQVVEMCRRSGKND